LIVSFYSFHQKESRSNSRPCKARSRSSKWRCSNSSRSPEHWTHQWRLWYKFF
jgi:hypothetical protein